MSNSTIELTPTEQAFKKVVQTAMAKVPRFVFRMYYATSGGYRSLNTPEAITPLAFSAHNLGKRPSTCFYKHNVRDIASIARMHLSGGRIPPTIFSSWSQSLGWVLRYACRMGVDRRTHVCILDTSLVDESVVILHTQQMAAVLGDAFAASYPWELLAFGPISGRAYQVMSLSDILRLTGPEPAAYQWRNLSSRSTATVVQALIKLCEHKFKLAIAAHCVSLCTTAPEEQEARRNIIRGLSRFPIPEGWELDTKTMNLENSALHAVPSETTEAIEAAKILRDLVRRAMAARTREVQGLRIQVKGWDGKSTRLRSGQ